MKTCCMWMLEDFPSSSPCFGYLWRFRELGQWSPPLLPPPCSLLRWEDHPGFFYFSLSVAYPELEHARGWNGWIANDLSPGRWDPQTGKPNAHVPCSPRFPPTLSVWTEGKLSVFFCFVILAPGGESTYWQDVQSNTRIAETCLPFIFNKRWKLASSQDVCKHPLCQVCCLYEPVALVQESSHRVQEAVSGGRNSPTPKFPVSDCRTDHQPVIFFLLYCLALCLKYYNSTSSTMIKNEFKYFCLINHIFY